MDSLRDTDYGTMPEVTVRCWSQAEGLFEDLVLDQLYPFHTLNDLKILIYEAKGRSSAWLPTQTFLGVPIGDVNESPTDRYMTTDTIWYSVLSPKTPLDVASPLKVCSGTAAPDKRFVDVQGNVTQLGRIDRGRSTLEDLYLIPREGVMPTFYAFCARDMLDRLEIPEGEPVGARDWNGRFLPYFPALGPTSYDPTMELIEAANIRLRYAQAEGQLMRALDESLEAAEPTVALQVSGIYALRLLWLLESAQVFEGAESMFFRVKANSRRPFLRLLPSDGNPITKIHTQGLLPIPDIADPNLILKWAEEVSPNSNEDYLFLKVLTRPITAGTITPVYATVRVFGDGSADAILLPSKQQKLLIPDVDLRDIDILLNDGVATTHLEGQRLGLGEVSLNLSLRLPRESKHLTRAQLLQRLRFFSPFFQESPAFLEPAPIIMLKYKAVSQFATEPRVFSFISQYMKRRVLSGDTIPAQMVEDVAREFALTVRESHDLIGKYLQQRDTFIVLAPEINTFSEENDAGIDIAIFGKHPFYSIEIYKCNSEITLRRIYTLLSLMLTLDIVPAVADRRAITVAEELAPETESLVLEEEEMEESAAQAASTSSSSESPVPAVASTAKAVPKHLAALMFDENALESEESENLGEVAAVGPIGPIPAPAPVPPKPVPMPPKPVPAPVGPIATAQAPNNNAATGRDWPAKAQGWFIKQLKKVDPGLFDFKPRHPKDLTYSRKCQANAGQQPMVLTQKEYDDMKEEYQNDKGIAFVEYPLRGTEVEPPPGVEKFTFMKYGTDPANLNYYFCPKYFCLLDRIMLLENDFLGTKWRSEEKRREGKPKPPNSCPFCGGKTITDQAKYTPGHTVIVRINKPKANRPQTFIGFAEPTTHPEGFQLPCCYLKDSTFRLSDPAFAAQQAAMRRGELRGVEPAEAEVAAAMMEEADELESLTATIKEGFPVQYTIVLARLPREYILGPEKHPLDVGKFGLIAPSLDQYFQQTSSSLVSRSAIRQELRSGARGFFRMGVEGAKRNSPDGLFGALAPYLLKESAEEVRERFAEVLQNPNIFLMVNYGNLVNEFYRPSDSTYAPKTENDLAQFATQLQTDYNPAINGPDIRRLYSAHKNFMDYLSSTKTVKEYRIFAPILAQPNLITPRGLILILLEYDAENLSAPVKVHCPPLGYNPDIERNADIAFLLRDKSGAYEALFYAEQTPATSAIPAHHTTMLRFQRAAEASTPKVVLERKKEFMTRCRGPGRSLYTSQSQINPKSMISYAQLMTAGLSSSVFGFVRDAYNHIVGVTFRSKDKRQPYLIPFPIVDDGFLPLGKHIHFDWQSVPVAPAAETLAFYAKYLAPILSYYKGYVPTTIFRKGDERQVEAIGLANGLMVPATGRLEGLTLPIQKLRDDPEWDINRGFVFETEQEADLQAALERVQALDRNKVEELYQHFRLSVANWLNSDEVDATFKRDLGNNVIFRKDLPLFERRKRLVLLLDAELRSWFVEDDGFLPEETAIFRRDCRKITDAGQCDGACIWRSGGEGAAAAEGGSCLLHIPTQSTLGRDTVVATADLFIRKVIDELLQFPQRRAQLLNNDVRKITQLKTAIQIGDQWIIPETSPTWIELLSLDWATTSHERPKFYEELTEATEAAAERGQPVEQNTMSDENMYALKEELAGELGLDAERYNVWMPPFESLVQFLGMSPEQLDLASDAKTFSDLALRTYIVKRSTAVILVKVSDAQPTPAIQVYRPFTPAPRALVMLQIGENTGLLVSRDEGIPNLLLTTLSAKLQEEYKRAPIIVQAVAAPAAAEPAAPAAAPTIRIKRKKEEPQAPLPAPAVTIRRARKLPTETT